MGQLAVLKIGIGNWEKGFAVTLRVGPEGQPHTVELDGHLPSAPHLLEKTETWRFSYRSRGTSGLYRALSAPAGQVTRQRTSLVAVSQDLVVALNEWLNSGDRTFQPIRDQLLKVIATESDIRLLIQTGHRELWQLPWHLWDLLHDHPNIDVVFSLGQFTASAQAPQPPPGPIRILVLQGSSDRLDIQTDLTLLQTHLPEAEIHITEQIQRAQLCQDLWQQSWDILFFAGHSSSDWQAGRLYLDGDTYLTLADLRYALQRTIAQGLQLAIFNSCDGLELARCLTDLQLPAAIVMRERVPDEAAHKFLQYFLESFAHQGRSLHLALRDARERLHAALDDKYPCASWLPLMCQSPTSSLSHWLKLKVSANQNSSPTPKSAEISVKVREQLCGSRRRRRYAKQILNICFVTSFILGVRAFGWLNLPELWAYDRLMLLQPDLPLDPRILLVTITDEDLKNFNKPLTDAAVNQVLTTLEKYQPKAIGLDIYRDIPLEPGNAELLKTLQTNPRVISVCSIGEDFPTPVLAAQSPSGVKTQQLGFADALMRDDDNVIRRYTLTMSARNKDCLTNYSLVARIIHNTLKSSGKIQLDYNELPLLKENIGGYQGIRRISLGAQILMRLNRSHKITEEVSLSNFLAHPTATSIRDRIILIGYTNHKTKDIHPTPVGQMYGVRIHAHVISQLLNASNGNKSFITVWPLKIEVIWILMWSFIGNFTGIRMRSLWAILFAQFSILTLLIGVCWCILGLGIWVPIVPGIIALFISTISMKLQQKTLPNINLNSLLGNSKSMKS